MMLVDYLFFVTCILLSFEAVAKEELENTSVAGSCSSGEDAKWRRLSPLESPVSVRFRRGLISLESAQALVDAADAKINTFSDYLCCFDHGPMGLRKLNVLWEAIEPSAGQMSKETAKEKKSRRRRPTRKFSEKDLIPGTSCVNSSISMALSHVTRHSWSVVLYPATNIKAAKAADSSFNFETSSWYQRPDPKIEAILASLGETIEAELGLAASLGGKWQITTYRSGGGGYSLHSDCNGSGKRDRTATVLIYLTDLLEEGNGGETIFPRLVKENETSGIPSALKVAPQIGAGLAWNNVAASSSEFLSSHCLDEAMHLAAPVLPFGGINTKEEMSSSPDIGRKVILQRWYHASAFEALGRPIPAATIPSRNATTALLQCNGADEQCRWYDEWSWEHLSNYHEWKVSGRGGA